MTLTNLYWVGGIAALLGAYYCIWSLIQMNKYDDDPYEKKFWDEK